MKNNFILFLGVVLSVACTKKDKDFSQDLVHPLSDSEVVVEYNGGTITAGDVKDKVKPQFERMRVELLQAYVKAGEELVYERQSASGSVSAAVPLSEVELDNYMRANKIPASEKEKVRSFLVTEKLRMKEQNARTEMFQKLNVRSKLGSARFDVEATSKMPSQGPSGAAVTVQVFCEFMNPMCNRSRMTMAELRIEFGDKVRWIFRHFPAPSNTGSTEASLAAICADEQGKFWPVHDKFFDLGITLVKQDLVKVAAEAGADADQMKTCLRSTETQVKLNAEIKSAMALGLTSTPGFFVNGVKVNSVDELKPAVLKALGK